MTLVDNLLKPFEIFISSEIPGAVAAGSNKNRLIHIEIGYNSDPPGKRCCKVPSSKDCSPGLGKIKAVDIVHMMWN